VIRRLVLALAALLLAPAAQAQDDLARESAKVEDLRSIREIKQLQALWGMEAIAGNWKAMAELGTEDVRMVLPDGDAVGQAALEQWLRERMGHGEDGMPARRLNLRLWFSPVITLASDGQNATGRWHQVALLGESGVSADWLGTTDVVRYRKTSRGWRIAYIRPYLHFVGPHATGWRHDADTLERAPYHYSPDEAGRLLPDRRAATPKTRVELDRDATELLQQGRVQNLVAAYGYYLDRAMYDDIVDLFAEDAVIDVAGQGRWRGKDGVRRFLARFGQPGLDEGELNDRPQLMPVVYMDEGEASIVNIELGMTGRHGGEGFWSATSQNFTLRCGADGNWRIVGLEQTPVMRAAYADGWANPLGPGIAPSSNGQPDEPSRRRATGYPEHTIIATDPLEVFPGEGSSACAAPVANALALAEAFDAAENVSNAYGYYIDQFAWSLTADLFARDGWKELSYIGTFIGRDRVRDSMIQRYGEGGPNPAFQAIHQKTQPYVTVLGDGTRAMIRTRLMQFNSSATGPGSWIGGIYENQVVKEDDVWRIHGMDLDYVWLADYATGWTGVDPEANARFAVPPERIAEFAPDAPLRGETFAPYPRIAPMGFHYANPVSGREPEVRLTWSDGHREEN
jgi:ketosteroid isomerase-like protein